MLHMKVHMQAYTPKAHELQGSPLPLPKHSFDYKPAWAWYNMQTIKSAALLHVSLLLESLSAG